MNQVAKLPMRGSGLLPVNETDALRAKVNNLAWVCWRVDEVLSYLQCQSHWGEEPSWALAEAERRLAELSKSELPSDIANTMALLEQAMQEATTEQIADGLTVLHGLFGSRGEPEVVATTGVEIIKAEHASTIALYSALLRMLRPARKERAHELDEWKRPPLRKFIPTIPEIIAELQDQQELWRENQSSLKEKLNGLPERHAQAHQGITKRVAELRVAVNDARRKTHTIEQAAAQDDGWDIPSEKHHYRK